MSLNFSYKWVTNCMDSNWTLSFGATKSMHAEKSEVIGREKSHQFHSRRVSLGSLWAFQILVPPYAPEVILFMHMQNKSLIETLLKDPP